MKTINSLLASLIILVIFYGCDDILEKDISDAVVSIQYPQPGQQIESNVANFQWSAVNGADNYRLQIYGASQNIVVDSLIEDNSFTCSLSPGTYQWRVRGENFAYETAYTFPAAFTMIQTDNLTNQQVQLLSPANGLYTSGTSFSYSWEPVTAAQSYNFQLIKAGAIVHSQTGITASSYIPSGITIDDAQYTWKVKAVNATTETVFATRTFYIDRVAPNQASLASPINNSTYDEGTEVAFEWTAPTENGTVNSPLSYTFQLSSAQSFSTVMHTATPATADYQYTFATAGTYYWRVKATDQAGNAGSYSTPYKIVIQ